MNNYCPTRNVSIRYFYDRDYRLFALGISNADQMQEVLSKVVKLHCVQDIRIALDFCDNDFEQFLP